MPHVALGIPETYETITRPVVFDIINQLEFLTTISKNIRILFTGQTEVGYQIGSTLTPGKESNTFLSEAQLTVKINETYNEDRVINTAVMGRENRMVFNDPALGVTLKPIYSHNDLVLNFTYRAPSLTSAKRFRDDLKMRRSMGRVENLHEVAYSYGIPFKFLAIMEEIYRVREATAGYGDTLNAWFTQNVSPKATTVTNLAGNAPNIVVGETQIGIVGWFDFLVAPDEEQKANETGAMDINFDYHIQYDRPTDMAINYPIVIHNTLLDEKWRGTGKIYQLNNRLRDPAWSRFLFDKFTPLYPSDASGIDGVQVPIFDDWRPRQVYPNTSSIITMLMQVDLNNPTDLLSLTNLGDYQIDSEVLAFLFKEAPYLNLYNLSVVHLELYDNDGVLGDTAIAVDSQLNLTTTFEMDPRKTYHLRIALVNDLLTLPREAQDRMRLAGPACLKILTMMEANLFGGVKLPTLVGGQIVSREDYLAAAQRINNQKVPLKSNIEYVFLATVGSFLIKAADGA